MNLYRKILDTIAKIATAISMIAVMIMVTFIVMELIRRNVFNKSFRPTIEICGISFLWMAFMGIIPLYNQGGLMRLDFLISRANHGCSFLRPVSVCQHPFLLHILHKDPLFRAVFPDGGGRSFHGPESVGRAD